MYVHKHLAADAPQKKKLKQEVQNVQNQQINAEFTINSQLSHFTTINSLYVYRAYIVHLFINIQGSPIHKNHIVYKSSHYQ